MEEAATARTTAAAASGCARPVGAYVIKDGEVSWKPAIDVGRMLLGWQVVAGIAALALWAFARRG